MPDAKLIYVVDADPAEQRRTCRRLAARGRTVRAFDDGAEVLAALRTERPDLVVCDLDLPGRNGLEVLEAVRRLRPGVPTLLYLSGEAGWRARRALRLGVIDGLATRPADGLFGRMAALLLGDDPEALELPPTTPPPLPWERAARPSYPPPQA